MSTCFGEESVGGRRIRADCGVVIGEGPVEGPLEQVWYPGNDALLALMGVRGMPGVYGVYGADGAGGADGGGDGILALLATREMLDAS